MISKIPSCDLLLSHIHSRGVAQGTHLEAAKALPEPFWIRVEKLYVENRHCACKVPVLEGVHGMDQHVIFRILDPHDEPRKVPLGELSNSGDEALLHVLQ